VQSVHLFRATEDSDCYAHKVCPRQDQGSPLSSVWLFKHFRVAFRITHAMCTWKYPGLQVHTVWLSTTKKYILKVHIKDVHENTKYYKCTQCKYVEARKDSLKAHIKFVHENIKDYKCSICEYLTTWKIALRERCTERADTPTEIQSDHN
jgi:hypothetical protein